MLRRLIPLILLVVCLAVPAAAQDGNWPGWRGDGTGHSNETGLPVDFAADGEELWRTEIGGKGHSSPAVFGNRVYVTTSRVSGEEMETQQRMIWVAWALAALALIGVLAAIAYAVRSKDLSGWSEAAGAKWFKALVGVERLAAIGVTLYFFYRLRTLLTVTAKTFLPDAPHLTWIFTGEVMVWGLIAMVAAFWVGSAPRRIGLLLLAAATYGFHAYMPRETANLAVPVGWYEHILKAGAAATAVFLAMEFLGLAAKFRREGKRPVAPVLWPVGVLAAMVVVFGFYNVWQPWLGVRRLVIALDADTGQIEWTRGVNAPSGRKYPGNSYATPTPVTNGEVVVAEFGPIMLGLGARRGRVLWEREEPGYLSYLRHGNAISPVLYDDRIIHAYYPELQEAGEPDPDWSFEERSYLALLDIKTGEEIWRTEGIPGGHDAFATPAVMQTDRGPAIVLIVFDMAHGYDLETGEHLWSFSTPLSVPVPSPVVDERTVYMSGGLYGPTVLAAIDIGDGGVSADGAPKARWSTTRGTPEVSSLLLVDGLLYWATQNGRMYCAQASDGEILWRERLPGSVNGSPVYADGHIYIPGADGEIYVIEAGREYNLLASNSINEPTFASPAIANGRIYIRTAKNLIAIGGRQGDAGAE
jgi:outer membrane protein assembly factor BamB